VSPGQGRLLQHHRNEAANGLLHGREPTARSMNATPGEPMARPRLPLDQVLSIIGLTGRFVGDDPFSPTHLRLRVGERGVLWPLRPAHGEANEEMLLAVADMVANASQLERTDRDLVAWSRLHLLDPTEPRTRTAFQLALVLDDLAERLFSRPVIHGLLETTTWRSHLEAQPAQPTNAGGTSWTTR
jgi:hypothetical protein